MLDWDDIKVGDYVRLSDASRWWIEKHGGQFTNDPLLVAKLVQQKNIVKVRKPDGRLLAVKGDAKVRADEWGSGNFTKIDRFMADVELALISGEGKKRE